MLNTETVSKLQEAGLLVMYASTGPYEGGYNIAKPKSTPGNSRRGYEVFFGPDEVICDAPCAHLYPKNDKWLFKVWECVPGPGPSDFLEEYSSIADAISSILDYYFNNPSKMNPPGR